MPMSAASSEMSPETTYQAYADREALFLNRFIYRDYKKRLLPFLARATSEFEYRPATHRQRSMKDEWGNRYYLYDDEPTLVSPLLLPTEPEKIGKSEVVTGWQVDVDAPPTWTDRFISTAATSNRLTLSEVLKTSLDGEVEPATSIVSSLTYPLRLHHDQTLPEDPDDEIYALHYQVLKDVRQSLGDTRPTDLPYY